MKKVKTLAIVSSVVALGLGSLALLSRDAQAGGLESPRHPFNPGNPPGLACGTNNKHGWECVPSTGICIITGVEADWCSQLCQPPGVYPPVTVSCRGNTTGAW